MIRWSEFKSAIEAAGLQARECSPGHWQAIGLERVNYWPHTRVGAKFHVCGSSDKARRCRSLDDVIKAAGGPATPQQQAERIAQNMLAESRGERPPWEEPRTHDVRDKLIITALGLSFMALTTALISIVMHFNR